MSSNSTNGTAKQKPVVASNNGKPELSNVVVSGSTPPIPNPETKEHPIQDRIKKFLELEKLLERRQVIEEAIENLNNFFIAPTGTGCNLKLQDSNGKTFGISHPSVIGEMVSMAKSKLQFDLNAIDEQFNFTI